MTDDLISPENRTSRNRNHSFKPGQTQHRAQTDSQAFNDVSWADTRNATRENTQASALNDIKDEFNSALYGTVTHNPFDSQLKDNNVFFPASQGLELLEQGIHLCQFGHTIPFVNGDHGSGKTFFIQTILDKLLETATCAYVAADHNDDDIAFELADQLGIELDSGQGIRDLALAVQHRQPLNQFDRYVVLVDDIDLLAESTIANLINSSQIPGSFHLLLGGTTDALDALDDLQLQEGLVKSIHLQPFNLLETRDYLNFKMRSAGYDSDDYFPQQSIKQLHKLTGGYAAALNREAEQLLFTREMEEDEYTSKASRFPLLHIGGLTLLLFILILAFFYSGDEPIDNNETLPLATEESTGQEAGSTTTEAEAGNPVATSQQQTASVAALNTISNTNNAVNNESGQAKEVVDTATDNDNTTSDKDSTVATQITTSKPITVDGDKAENVTASATATSSESRTEANPAANESGTSGLTDTTTYTRDEQVVMAWPDDRLSLQVAGAFDKKGLENYREQQPNKDDLLLLTVLRNNRPWHILVTGPFSTNTVARQAIQQLPQTQINDSPWVRKTAILKQQIALFRGQ